MIADVFADSKTVMQGVGCPECRGTGYRGRIGIYELLLLNDEVRKVLLHRRDAAAVRDCMIASGTPSLRDDGWRLVREGVTTIEEVARVTPR
jgi:type II secretory ATPase GspE/PulE/Tfp pilus assembly ATPase PilB-like protein